MSSEKTTELDLHKWAATDYVQRTEFNDNFAKIDEHAAEVTTQLAHTATKAELQTLDTHKATKSEVNSLATNKADKTYVDALISSVADGSPRDVFYSIAALQASFPTGEIGTYLVFDTSFTDGAHIFIWKTVWTDLGVYQGKSIPNGAVTPEKTNFFVVDKNLFNKNAVTNERYISDTGSLVFHANYKVSDFVPVTPSTTLTLNLFDFGAIHYYDATKGHLGYIAETKDKKGPLTFTSPSGATYIRWTIINSQLTGTQLELGTQVTNFKPYGYIIPTTTIDGLDDIKATVDGIESVRVTTITVAPTGGDFTNVADALNSITTASPTDRYVIFVKKGTYEGTFRTKNYVDIVGEDKYQTVLTYTGTLATWVDTSTVFLESETSIENLTIEATDTKYPMHVDKFTGQWTAKLKNVRMIHKGSLTDTAKAGTPLGIGLYEGQHLVVEECELIGNNVFGNAGVFFHNQLSSTGKGYRSLRVERCKIKGVSYGFRPNSFSPVYDQKNDAFLTNNEIQANVAEFYCDIANGDYSWNIYSFGNTLNRVNTTDNAYYIEQVGFTRRIKNNGATLSRGSVVQLFDTQSGKPSTADTALVIGVALHDIPSTTVGVIQIRGYVNAVKVNGSTAIATDTLLGSKGGGVAKASTTNPFAVAFGSYAVADDNGLIPAILLKNLSV